MLLGCQKTRIKLEKRKLFFLGSLKLQLTNVLEQTKTYVTIILKYKEYLTAMPVLWGFPGQRPKTVIRIRDA